MTKTATYPFIPKSTASMLPGQFWEIPLTNGKFACGRVLQLVKNARYGNRTSFLAGLIDWCGDDLPTEESIAGCKLLEQGRAHIKTITWNGGQLLGYRSLELDNIIPFFKLSHMPSHNCMLMKGLDIVRKATLKEQKTLYTHSVYGLAVVKIMAEQYFVENQRRKEKLPWDEKQELLAFIKSQKTKR